MADRELRVVLLGDSSSLQGATVKAEASVASFETRMKNAVIVTGEAGALSDGLARKMNSLEQLGLNPASVALIGVAASAGLAVEVSKVLIDKSEQNTKAQLDLTQAYEAQKLTLSNFQGGIDQWLLTNKRFIEDEYAAKESIAQLTRAGFDQTIVMRIMNDALDLSAVKHVSLTEAVQTLIMAEEGNTRGLRDLGFSATDLNAIMKAAPESLKDVESAQKALTASSDKLAAAQDALDHFEIVLHEKKKVSKADLDTEREKKEAVTKATNDLKAAQNELATATSGVVVNTQSQSALLTLLEPKIAKGRETTSELKQAQNDLNRSTDDFANRYGPNLEKALANGVDIINLTVQAIGILAVDLQGVLAQMAGAAAGGGGGSRYQPGGRNPNEGAGAGLPPNPGADYGLPGYGGKGKPGGSGHGGGTGGMNITQYITGSSDPAATANIVNQRLAALLS